MKLLAYLTLKLAFIRKGVIIKKQELIDFKSIYIQFDIDGQLVNKINICEE